MSYRALTALMSFVLALGAASVSSAAGVQSSGPGHLAVRGQDIVDPSGRPIVLRGWNWGHFGKAVEQDAADNAAQGANVVRLPIRWWGFYQGEGIESRNDQAPGGIDPHQLQIIDDNIRWASRAHLWIVLFIDSNCGQNGTQNDKMVQYCDPGHKYPNGHNFWTDPDARARFISLWRFIAARYKDTPYLGMFEPLPEPGGEGTSGEQIQQFYGETMNAIRQVAPGIPFLIGGYKYRAPQVRQVYNPAWKDVVYTGNLFLHEGGGEGGGFGGGGKKKRGGGGGGDNLGMGSIRERAQELLDLRAKANVPLFIQQIGVKQGEDPDQSQLRQLLGLVNDNHIGFAYWEYRGSKSPDSYGVLFGQGKNGRGQWETNQPALSAISQAFKR